MSSNENSTSEGVLKHATAATLWVVSLTMQAQQGNAYAHLIGLAIKKRAGGVIDMEHKDAVMLATCEGYEQLVLSGLADKITAHLIDMLDLAAILVRFANGEDV